MDLCSLLLIVNYHFSSLVGGVPAIHAGIYYLSL